MTGQLKNLFRLNGNRWKLRPDVAATITKVRPETRAQAYRLFATWFGPPAREVWLDALAEGSFRAMPSSEVLSTCGLDLDKHRFQGGGDFKGLAQVYSSSFEVGNPAVSFHERAYTRAVANELFEELFRFYEHFGLDLKNSDNVHWPDSLLVELDFMQYLSHLESIAVRQEDVLSLQRGQYDFLDRHLVPLVKGIVDKLHTVNIEPYDQLARLLECHVEHELGHCSTSK